MTFSANLDLVRSIYADLERGDFRRVDCAHAEIEYVRADGPDAASWTGLVGVAEAARARLSAWEDFRTEAEEYRELDNESVLVLMRATGRAKTSGLELGQMGSRGAVVFHLRGGKVTRLVSYMDRENALADLGLKE